MKTSQGSFPQWKALWFLILPLLLFQTAFAQDFKGEIIGHVIDAKTHEPIPGVNVVVVQQPTVGTTTDGNGSFRLSKLKVGTYGVRISAIGYVAQVVTNVVVTTGRPFMLSAKLETTPLEMGEVSVKAGYFSRAQQISPVSANVLERAEILRSPGGIQDVQRVVQSLPGVASSTDNINELIVRGGAPYENLTVMDYMEIPSINHYADDFSSAGPINMVNAEMIEDAQFSAGGFPVQYGDKCSSVLNLTVREGNRNIGFSSKSGFNMAGIGTLVEGGLAGGRGSYIFSARNSLLEVLDKIVGLSSISLTAVPHYYDTQGKVVYDLNPSNKLFANFLYGDSRINFAGDPKEKDVLRKNLTDSSSVEAFHPVTDQYAVGLSLRTLWGKKGFSVVTLYSQGRSDRVDVRQDFTRRVWDGEGKVLQHNLLNSRMVYSERSLESFIGLKGDFFYQIHSRHDLSIGGQVLTARKWNDDVFVEADTLRYDLNHDGIFETGPVVIPQYLFSEHLRLGDASKYYFYISDKYKLASRLAVTFGLRYDHFTYSGKGSLSPRANLAYQLFPQTTTLTFALGKYTQIPPFPYYSDRRNIGYNKTLDDMQADHFVLGIEHILDHGLKLSLETYYKTYKGVAVSEDFVYSAIDTFWSDRMLTVGKRYSYGLEFFLEQRQVSDYFGTVSVSLSRSREKDPRIPQQVKEYPSDFDYPVILTFLGGKVVKQVRAKLDRTPFFIKYPAKILPLSDEMEISLKYRYQTGRPYTPMTYVTWQQFREGGVKWSRGAWVESGDHNSSRYSDYSRLDLQWISRFYHSAWNINVYIALQNIFVTKNVFYENYRSDGKKETIYQFAFFPVGGVEIEF